MSIYENSKYKIEVGFIKEVERDGYLIINKQHEVTEQAFTELPQTLGYADHLEFLLEDNRWKEPVMQAREKASGLDLPGKIKKEH